MVAILRVFALAFLAAFACHGAAAEEQPAREQVGAPVQQAQSLFKRKEFAAARAKLREADAVKDKTAYETYVVEQTRAAVESGAGDYAAAITALEAALATGVPQGAERLERIATEAELAYRLKSYDTALAYAGRYFKEGGTAEPLRLLMAEAYYLKGDFANAAAAAHAVLAAEDKAGKVPGEDLLLMLASSAYKGGDSVGYRGALARLVASHPKADYWRDLLAATGSASGFAPRLALDLDRLEAATGTLDTAAQYVQAAELALEQGLPGDAKAFLGQGYAAGVLGQGADAARHQRLLDLATRQALADAKSFPALAQEAAAAASGVPWQKLAEARASLGQYDEAITAFERALQKGGLKFPDDAKLHLGIACLRAGQAARAKEVLTSVSGNDGTAELARLWLIRGSGA